MLWQIILANVIIKSAGSLIGVVTLAIDEKRLQKILLAFVALSAGALMGSSFFHLLPEALEKWGPKPVLGLTLLSFNAFFIIERIFHWRHCHYGHCEVHSFGYLNLLGDALHNFIDGLVIAATFLVSPGLGMATTLAVALHEIPQEIGDFGVLLYSGFSKKKAIGANILVAMTAIIGGIVGYAIHGSGVDVESYLLPVAAGGFIYIASADLMPEIRKEHNLARSLVAYSLFLMGILLMYVISGGGFD